MTDIEGGPSAQPDLADRQTDAAKALGEDVRTAQRDDEEIEDEAGVDDENDDEIDLDDEDDDDDLDDDENIDDGDDIDEEDVGFDDDGNPLSH